MKDLVTKDTPHTKVGKANNSSIAIMDNNIIIVLLLLCSMSVLGCSFISKSINNATELSKTINNQITTSNNQKTTSNANDNQKTTSNANDNQSPSAKAIDNQKSKSRWTSDQPIEPYTDYKPNYTAFKITTISNHLLPYSPNNIENPYKEYSPKQLAEARDKERILRNTMVENALKLIDAIEIGQIDIVKQFIPSGADINAIVPKRFVTFPYIHPKTPEQWTALENTNIRNPENIGLSLLGIATKNSHKNIVDFLIDSGANVNLEQNTTIKLKVLIKNKKMNMTISENATVLHIVSGTGNIDIFNKIIDSGANINAVTKRGDTPLHFAIFTDNTVIATKLIKLGANVNVKGNDGYTPLHMATNAGNSEVVHELIAKGADINATNNVGDTPLHFADNAEIVRMLKAGNADVNAKNNYGRTPLHYAANAGKIDVANELIVLGADINTRDNAGDTPLHSAADAGNSEVARALVVSGADINARNNDGFSSLHYAKNSAVVHELITLGADINAKSELGYTPLHIAANSGRTDVIKALVESGADVYAIDNNGFTPHNLAIQKDHTEALEELLALSSSSNTENINTFYKQVDACIASMKPTPEQAKQKTLQYIKGDYSRSIDNKDYSSMSDDDILKTKDYNDQYKIKYQQLVNFYTNDIDRIRLQCEKRSIMSYSDSQKLPIIYDYCHGSEAAWLGSIGGSQQLDSPIPPDQILESHDTVFTRTYMNRTTNHSFGGCIEQFDIYKVDYVTSKDYFINRLQNDYNRFSKDAAKARKEIAQAKKRQAKQKQAAWNNYIYNNSPRGKCESDCNKRYKKNSDSWKTCMSYCEDLRSDVIEN